MLLLWKTCPLKASLASSTENFRVWLNSLEDLSMSCTKNSLGQSSCQIVQHPDRLGESFCATCNRRFANRDETLEAVPLALTTGFALLLLLLIL